MTETLPLVSVVVPVYNVEKYLSRCLDSVLAQTLKNFEVICVDDCSTDSSCRIVREYAAKDARIAVLQNERNLGLSCARNAGLAKAQAKYVYFLDSDDAILPDCLEKAWQRAEHDDADIVIFGAVEKEEGKADAFYVVPEPLCNAVVGGAALFAALRRADEVVAPVQFKLWRRSFLAESGLCFYEGIYHEDELFFFAELMAARRVVCIQDVLYLYYRNPGSIMRRKYEFKHIASLVAVIDEIEKIHEKGDFPEGVSDAVLKHIANFCLSCAERMYVYGFKNLPQTSPLFDKRKQILYIFAEHLALLQFRYMVTEEQCDYLKSFEHVLLYGAGKIGKEVLFQLLKADLRNVDVVVTDTSAHFSSALYGVPIKGIGALDYQKERCVVIVAVGKRLRGDVERNVRRLGYEHYIYYEELNGSAAEKL